MKRANRLKLRGTATFTLDEKTYKKLRKLQAKKIRKTKQNWNFSKIVGLVLYKGIKKIRKDKQ